MKLILVISNKHGCFTYPCEYSSKEKLEKELEESIKESNDDNVTTLSVNNNFHNMERDGVKFYRIYTLEEYFNEFDTITHVTNTNEKDWKDVSYQYLTTQERIDRGFIKK